MFRPAEAFHRGTRSYVPGMQYHSALVHGQPTAFSLGAPAASDDDIVDDDVAANATVGTEVTQTYVSDSPYGRTMIVTVSGDPGAAGGVMDVHGEDYLGQKMVERFTGVNGATAILYGKKAFYRVTKTKIVTAATNAVTNKIGTGRQLGLPFKGDISWAKENGVFVPLVKRNVWVWRTIPGASVAGGPSGAWIYADFPGYVVTEKSVADMPVGSTNDPAVTVELATVAIVGLTNTVDVSAAATAALTSDTPTTAGYSANNRFRPGDLIELVASDADAAVGAIQVGLELASMQFVPPVLTDPGTAITGDPRGCYEGLLTMDGAKEIIVGLIGDPAVNTSDNGGLHGIQHYYA